MGGEVLYKDLSYQIIGCCFEVHNQLGPGHKEIYYQRALAKAFKKAGLNFKQQVRIAIRFNGDKVGEYVLDFIIEDKIIIEIKKKQRFTRHDFGQAEQYLQATNNKLAILIAFGGDDLIQRRVLNPDNLLDMG